MPCACGGETGGYGSIIETAVSADLAAQPLQVHDFAGLPSRTAAARCIVVLQPTPEVIRLGRGSAGHG